MIQTDHLTLSFGGRTLFEDVNAKFLPGNCYGLIGANGAGKSTFLKILSGDIQPTKGEVVIGDKKRISVMKQNQFEYDEFTVMDTVLMGHTELFTIYDERNKLYAKPSLTEAEGLRAGDLESIFGDMDGYTAESDAATLLSDLGLPESLHQTQMSALEAGQKVRVLLAQALFGNPDILLLDEPTNQLDYKSVLWLEQFLYDFPNTVIIVSHDRHFLNKVCTHIADLDFKQIRLYAGNYDFWLQSSQLVMKQKQDLHKKSSEKIKELEDFIRRFSANASKSKQATSRKKLIDTLRPDELPVSSRKSPYISFKVKRPCGTNILTVKNLSYTLGDAVLFKNLSFSLEKKDKLAILAENTLAKTTLLSLLAGKLQPQTGTIEWGEGSVYDYFPKDNSEYFGKDTPLLDWLNEKNSGLDNQTLRGYLGRMLFSGDEAKKNVKVLSGGEKARAMFAKLMLSEGNVLLFDEPTDHLDLESISALNIGLSQFTDCLIMTSHDFELLNTVPNRFIEITPTGFREKRGSFEDFLGN